MRSLLTTGACLALAALALASPCALAGEEQSAPPDEPEGVSWVEGFEPGREKAIHTGRLMLVYVHRTSPH